MPSAVVLSSLENARPRGTPGGRSAAQLSAARGEWESFQVVVHAGSRGLKALSIRAEPIADASGGRLVANVHRVAFLDVRRLSNEEGSIGPWPDALIPDVDAFDHQRRRAFPIEVAPGDDATAWIDLFVPRGATAGTYRGTVVVENEGKVLARVPVELRVRGFAIPATSSLPVTFGFFARTAARAHHGTSHEATPEELRELARKYGIAALRDRISIHGGTVEAAPFTKSDDGSMRIDFQDYDAEIAPFLDGTADPRGPAEGARWTAFDLRVPWKLEGAERSEYVRAMAAHLEARGWLSRVFDFTADEPPPSKFPALRARSQAVHSGDPRVARLVTRPPMTALDGAVDIWCPVVNLVDIKANAPDLGTAPMRDDFATRAARGERLWWYQSCLSHGCDGPGHDDAPRSVRRWFTGWPSLVVDSPPVGQRVFEWLSFRRRMGGELYFDTVDAFAEGDPWRDQYRHAGNGDGTLFYPGRPDVIGGTSHIPVESIRLKRIRDGLEDYEYLALAAHTAGFEATDRVAEHVAEHAWKWDHDPAHLLAARDEIARLIEAGAASPATVTPSARPH